MGAINDLIYNMATPRNCHAAISWGCLNLFDFYSRYHPISWRRFFKLGLAHINIEKM